MRNVRSGSGAKEMILFWVQNRLKEYPVIIYSFSTSQSQINNNTERTPMSSFQDLGVFRYPEAEAHAALNDKTER